MTEAERQFARAALIRELSVKQLIADLHGKRYGDLVDKHMREFGSQLPAIIAVHEELVHPEESEGVMNIVHDMDRHALEPGYWGVDAGQVLMSMSCKLNDAMFPAHAEDAGVFILFQLVTTRFAERARLDKSFHRMVTSRLDNHNRHATNFGTI